MIFDEDWRFLELRYGRANGPSAIGTGTAIRDLVHGWVSKVKAKEQAEIDKRTGGQDGQHG